MSAHRFVRPLLGILGALILFAIFDRVTRLGLVPTIYLPHATTVASRVVSLLGEPAFLGNVGATVFAWAIGMAIACALGIPLGIVMGSSAAAFKIFSPVVDLMRPIPSVCLIPLAILIWGQDLTMKVILVGYATLWPILINTVYGVHDVDPLAVQTARCFGLPRLAIMRRISIPGAAPMVFTGIRISASIGLIVLVSAELLAATNTGIGAYIFNISSAGGHMDSVLAAAVVAGLLGVAINGVLAAIDARLFAWRHAERRGQ